MATTISERAIALHHYIRKYIPRGWKEPIGSVASVPFIADNEFLLLQKGEFPERIDKWYLKEAIKAYFLTFGGWDGEEWRKG